MCGCLFGAKWKNRINLKEETLANRCDCLDWFLCESFQVGQHGRHAGVPGARGAGRKILRKGTAIHLFLFFVFIFSKNSFLCLSSRIETTSTRPIETIVKNISRSSQASPVGGHDSPVGSWPIIGNPSGAFSNFFGRRLYFSFVEHYDHETDESEIFSEKVVHFFTTKRIVGRSIFF